MTQEQEKVIERIKRRIVLGKCEKNIEIKVKGREINENREKDKTSDIL